MTGLAITLVLTAAFVHATWNFWAKRAGGGAAFVWLFAVCSTVIYLPLLLIAIFSQKPHLGQTELLFIGGSAGLHLVYFLLLQQGYRAGDLSLVYPLARGTGPTLSTAAAILFLGERPTWIALVGAMLVIVGMFILTGGTSHFRGGKALRKAAIFGLLTGTIIASYTLWDKYAVSVLFIPPIIMDYGTALGRVLLLAPFTYQHWGEVCTEWRTHRFEVLGVGLFSPLSYILVLTAMVFTPVSYVAPAREVSTLIVTLMGARLLQEGHASRRLVAAGLIVGGIVTLALN